LHSVLVLKMPRKSNASSAEPNVSRKMSDEQYRIVFDAFISADPIGGKTDGLMGKKSKEVWEPMAEAVRAKLTDVVQRHVQNKEPHKDLDGFTAEFVSVASRMIWNGTKKLWTR
jgi:hypothetical protein